MRTKKEKTKEERIKTEKNRLNRIYMDIDAKRKATVQGLIERAAHQRIALEDFEADLETNGYVEWFRQGEQDPYERKRPVADLYNTMNTSYQKAIKQLSDLLPKELPKQQGPTDDGFDDFVNSREDL